MTPQEFYSTQSPLSDPASYSYLYNDLPDDLPSLCRIIQNITLHYRGAPAAGIAISPERMEQVNNRRIETILGALMAQQDASLTTPRPNDTRSVGCCRDDSLLLCSFLRHKGIPARIRYGFAAYIKLSETFFAPDHVVTEYWAEGRWKLADPEISDWAINAWNITFDPFDIPRDQFLVGGQVWQAVREGRANPMEYGVHPSVPELCGTEFIRADLAKDITFLNKQEYLLWDEWGIQDPDTPLTDDRLALMDEIAALSINAHDDAHFESIRAFATHPDFIKPAVIKCYNPVGAFFQVEA